LNEVIPGAAVSVLEAYTFRKLFFNRQTFYSKDYTKVRKRNSYRPTVSFVSRDGALAVGYIFNFIKVLLEDKDQPYFLLAAIRELQATPNYGLFTDIDMSYVRNRELGGHLKPFSYNR
jgi:hypothetical protein